MMPDDASVENLIAMLGMKRHPEGGFYAETFRSELPVASLEHDASRAGSTAIYYLLERGSFSALHRVHSDEVWHHYLGAKLTLHLIAPDGTYTSQVLGKQLALGERPQIVVPRGTWQAATVASAESAAFVLCGCTVAPGFEFTDFELGERAELCRAYPEHARLIAQLTR